MQLLVVLLTVTPVLTDFLRGRVNERTFYPANDHGLVYVYKGRWLLEKGTARADWPCSGVQFSFTTTSSNSSSSSTLPEEVDDGEEEAIRTHIPEAIWTRISLRLMIGRVRVSVEVTNSKTGVVESSTILEGSAILDFAKNYDILVENLSPDTTYNVSLKKLTQASPFNNGLGKHLKSILEFHGVELENIVQIREPSSLATRRIDYIGASDTAGFCVDGTPETTDGMAKPWKYDNCDMTSHAMLGRRLNAEVNVQAIAGIGLTQNAFASMPFLLGKNTMPEYYKRVLQTQEKPAWDFEQSRPDLVVVSLGGNDFNHQNSIPSNASFAEAYEVFLHEIARPYMQDGGTSPTIVNICGQGDPTEVERDPNNDRCRPCPHVKDATESFQNKYGDTIRVEYVFIPCDGTVVTGIDDIGCEGHKNQLGQERVADFLEPHFRQIMGWSTSAAEAPTLVETPSTSYKQQPVVATWTNDYRNTTAAILALHFAAVLLIVRHAIRRYFKNWRCKYYVKAKVAEVDEDISLTYTGNAIKHESYEDPATYAA